MNRFKDDIKTIIQLLFSGIIFLSISTIDNPIVSIIFLGLWIVVLTYNLYSKIQYRKGNVNYILFPTINDPYWKITSIILGLIFFVLSCFAFSLTVNFKFHGAIGILVGLLVLCNGIFDLPKGMIKIEKNEMNISGLKEIVDKRQVREISIHKDRIILTDVYDKTIRIGNLNIDTVSAKLINNYITKNNENNDLIIVNNVC